MTRKYKRDKNGRFASGGGSSISDRLARYDTYKRVAGYAGAAAGLAAAGYVGHRALTSRKIKVSEVGTRPVAHGLREATAPAAKPKRPASHNRSISLGHGVRIKGAQVSTLEQAASVALNNTRNHGIVAHSSDKLRTAKSLEKLALVERRNHPEGTPEHAARKPHYVITRQGVDALVKSGLLTTADRDKWERARGRESFNNNL